MAECKACGAWFSSSNERTKLCHGCERALNRLNGYAVPVVHGRWERDEWGSHLRRCSVCKKSPVYKDERGNGVAVYAGICINCGARMDLEV